MPVILLLKMAEHSRQAEKKNLTPVEAVQIEGLV